MTSIAIVAVLATLVPVQVSAEESRSAGAPLATTVADRVIREIRRLDTQSYGTPLRNARIVSMDPAGPFWPARSTPRPTAPIGSATRAAQSAPCCWTRVMALRPGQWINIELAGRQRMRGRVISVDHDAVTLAPATGGDARRINRTDVVRVRAEPSQRLVVAGFVLAAGVGLLIADGATRPGEALVPGKFWLAGMPLTIGGSVVAYKEMLRTGLIYRFY